MQKNGLWTICILLILVGASICYADETNESSANTTTGFVGIWVDTNNTLVFTGEGDTFTGIYDKADGSHLVMDGILSEDGKVLNGNWSTEGNFIYTLADDGKSFSGTYGYGENSTVEGVPPETYNLTGPSSLEDKNVTWTGSWAKENEEPGSLTQEDDVVSGTLNDQGMPVDLAGNLSEDAKEWTGTWTVIGRYSFTLSDDGDAFNGTYGFGSEVSTLPWIGTRTE